VAFGEALGYMGNAWIDVHGAGAQRSDPKSGDPAEYASGHGPQGDAVRIYNYARCVRGGEAIYTPDGVSNAERPSMTIQSTGVQQAQSSGAPGQGGGLARVEAGSWSDSSWTKSGRSLHR
jgi:hypothetical protein